MCYRQTDKQTDSSGYRVATATKNIALYISLNYQCIFCAKLFCVFLVCNICIASYKSLGCQYSWIFKFPLADLSVFSCLCTSVWVKMWVVTDTLHWSMATQFLVFTILFFTEHISLAVRAKSRLRDTIAQTWYYHVCVILRLRQVLDTKKKFWQMCSLLVIATQCVYVPKIHFKLFLEQNI